MRSEADFAVVGRAMVSSAIGGTSAALVRFMVGSTDPITLSAFRFGSGFIVLLPVTLMMHGRWPRGSDWAGVIGLGILFFGGPFWRKIAPTRPDVGLRQGRPGSQSAGLPSLAVVASIRKDGR